MKRLPGRGSRVTRPVRRATAARAGRPSDAPGNAAPAHENAESTSPDPHEDAAESPPALPPAKRESDDADGASMSVREHLVELRTRLIRCILSIFVGFMACYSFSEQLFAWLSIPLQAAMPEGGTMMFTRPTEGFMVDMEIALVAGLVLACPYVFYQLWAFVAPGLYKEERRHVLPLAMGSALLFLSGAAFCYFGAFPVAFKFFMGFAKPGIRASITLDSYLGFSLRMLVAFGLVFQLPLISYFLARLGVISAALLRGWRKYAIVGNFIVAALITPPDVFSQMFMVVPLLLLYEVSIWVCSVAQPKPKPQPQPQA